LQDSFRRTGIEIGDRVLDVGFRDAGELKAIAERVGPTGRVVGLDVDPERVESAREALVRQAAVNVAVEEGSVLDVPFGDRTFDVVFCKGVLHEVRRLTGALEESARVCASAGVLCIVDIKRFSRLRFEAYRWGSWLRGRRTGDVHPGLPLDRLRRLIRSAGFEEEWYEELPTRWRLGFNRVETFLLRARRTV
jgi:ubiquinone/menaquinone biosynthesis C-methylase UbiE